MNASYKINLECYDYSGRGYYLYDKRVFDFSAVELQHHIVTCGMPRTYFTKQEPVAEGSFLSAKIQTAGRNLK